MFFFFFSSRRRHTRCSRDWSSDVCSSDLPIPVWMGGGWDRQKRTTVEPALRRIARMGDGWFTHLPPNDDGRTGMETFRRLVQEEGRDPATVPVEGRLPAAGSGPEE